MSASCYGITLPPREFALPAQNQIVYRKLADARAALDFEVWTIWRKVERNPVMLDLI